MNIIILIAVAGFAISSVSFFVIHKVAKRPANGEVMTLSRLTDKIGGTTHCLRQLTLS